jgi:hypothetical protein
MFQFFLEAKVYVTNGIRGAVLVFWIVGLRYMYAFVLRISSFSGFVLVVYMRVSWLDSERRLIHVISHLATDD